MTRQTTGKNATSSQSITQRFLSKRDFGALFDVSEWTVDTYIASKLVKSVLLGGRRLIPVGEVDRLEADLLAGRSPLSKGHLRGVAALAAKRKASAEASAEAITT
jgi:hypothetical protein